MQYKVKLNYFDGKNLDVVLDNKKRDEFFKSLRDGLIYWTSDEEEYGLWLNPEKIRYIEFLSISTSKEEENNEEVEVDSSSGEISHEIKESSGAEETITE